MLLKFVEMSGDPRTLPVEAPTKKIPVRVKRVCVACRASHHSCGIERPCRRCVSRGTECVDAECRKRGRKPHQDLDGLTEGFIIDFSHNFQTEPASDADHAQLDSRTSTPTESHMNRDGDVKYPKDNQANSPVDRDAVSVSQNHSNHSPLIQAEGNTPEPNTFAVHPYLCPQSTMQLQIDAGQAVMIDPFGQITYVSVESPQVVRIEAAASPIALSTTEQLQTLSNIMYQNQLHSQGQSQLQNQVDSLHHQQMAAMLAPPPIVYNTMVDLRNDPAEQYRLESSITHRSSLEALYPAKAPYSYQATISRPVYVPHDQTERDFSSIKPSQFQNDLASYAQDILTTHLEQHAKTRKANSFTPLSSTYRLGHPKMDRVEAFSIICMRMVETLALIPDHVMSADPVRQVMWISRLLKNVVLFSLKGPLPMTVVPIQTVPSMNRQTRFYHCAIQGPQCTEEEREFNLMTTTMVSYRLLPDSQAFPLRQMATILYNIHEKPTMFSVQIFSLLLEFIEDSRFMLRLADFSPSQLPNSSLRHILAEE